MRVLILAAGAALTLSACGGDRSETNTADMMANDANMMAADNMMMDQNMTINGTTMDGNMADPATQNMIMQDMNTNEPDTNLANGI